ncbi:hypothetical protein Q3G72_033303 [Acer saccharum]|nr:hypothetical protein Q3G72_033303 [Acer saccharum]
MKAYAVQMNPVPVTILAIPGLLPPDCYKNPDRNSARIIISRTTTTRMIKNSGQYPDAEESQGSQCFHKTWLEKTLDQVNQRRGLRLEWRGTAQSHVKTISGWFLQGVDCGNGTQEISGFEVLFWL